MISKTTRIRPRKDEKQQKPSKISVRSSEISQNLAQIFPKKKIPKYARSTPSRQKNKWVDRIGFLGFQRRRFDIRSTDLGFLRMKFVADRRSSRLVGGNRWGQVWRVESNGSLNSPNQNSQTSNKCLEVKRTFKLCYFLKVISWQIFLLFYSKKKMIRKQRVIKYFEVNCKFKQKERTYLRSKLEHS